MNTWLQNTIKALDEAGFRPQAGIPLLALSQYDTVPLQGPQGSERVLQVSRVGDGERVYVQLWWTRRKSVDVHVTVFTDSAPDFALTDEWLISGLPPETAHGIVGDLAHGAEIPAPSACLH